ncbi:glycoprotein IX (platelet) isoform X1 [Neoarius graeffei]|uniref:glycoprotein IX (platelet) isoform X1 n=1 Tax=Neoarius graeffei TaxID=443677 RepID=UPI00298BF96E|nr:glycoprotein IX (platelet) isoform X1 [Neoarius graeffei]XP_060793088.1 glycoprotein IX (platelet) isoform X1 [Neoarius graeffei]XP_060793089.1 glycoprotein IX (platelet) isoform X1 [Neoarius graeffei]
MEQATIFFYLINVKRKNKEILVREQLFIAAIIPTLRMISALVAVMILLVRNVTSSCSCSGSPSSGLSVNCSSRDLNRIPDLPPNTTELYLQHNHLVTVLPGFFDRLLELRVVDLSGNPFHCGCNIQYLRVWLLKNRNVTTVHPRCATPASQAHRAIISLSETMFSSCVRSRCSSAGYNLVLGFLLCGILGLLLWSLRLSKGLSFSLGISEKHASLRVESLPSLKPKHTAKVKYSAQWSEDLETPLLDMDILPQIIDTLHKRHNIKIQEM